jgi:hypothetical protein
LLRSRRFAETGIPDRARPPNARANPRSCEKPYSAALARRRIARIEHTQRAAGRALRLVVAGERLRIDLGADASRDDREDLASPPKLRGDDRDRAIGV